MENTEQAIKFEDYEASDNSEETEAVKQFFLDNPTIPLTNEQKVQFLSSVDGWGGNGINWEGGNEYGDGHSYCEVHSIEGTDIQIGLDMTYSSWDSSYFNGDVGIVKYTDKVVKVPSLVKSL